MNVTDTRTFSRGSPQPKFKTEFTVSDVNTAERYEEFCRAVDCLAERFNTRPDEVDWAVAADGCLLNLPKRP